MDVHYGDEIAREPWDLILIAILSKKYSTTAVVHNTRETAPLRR